MGDFFTDIEKGVRWASKIMKDGEKLIENGKSFIDKVQKTKGVQDNPKLNMAAEVGKAKLLSYQERVKKINSISTDKLKRAKKVLDNVIKDREKDKDVIEAEFTEVKK